MFIFDLDETIYIGDIVAKAAKNIGLDPNKVNGSNINDVLLSNCSKELKDEVIRLFKDPIEGAINKYPLPGTRLLINRLQQVGQCIRFVTSRPKQLTDTTKYCIWRDFGTTIASEAKIYFPNKSHEIKHVSKKGKLRTLSKMDMDTYYFDDNIKHCNEALEAGIDNVHLVTNSHTGWNKNKNVPTGVTKIKSVIDIENLYSDLLWRT